MTTTEHPPLECIKEMIALARAGKVISFEFWRHETHLQAWTIDMLEQWATKPDEPVFAGPDDQLCELCTSLRELCNVLGCDCSANPDAMQGPISSQLLKFLIEMLLKWLADQASSGGLAQVMLELFERATANQ